MRVQARANWRSAGTPVACAARTGPTPAPAPSAHRTGQSRHRRSRRGSSPPIRFGHRPQRPPPTTDGGFDLGGVEYLGKSAASRGRGDIVLLEGKRALIMGVANKRSIAWGIAAAFHREGAE